VLLAVLDVGADAGVATALASATAPAPVSSEAVATATNVRLFQFSELMVMSFRQQRDCRVTGREWIAPCEGGDNPTSRLR